MSIVYVHHSTGDLLAEYATIDIFTSKIINEFDKPLFENIFYRNKDFLLTNNNFDLIPFNKDTWMSNPKQFCTDHYKIHHLDKLILMINDIPNFFEFTNDYMQNIKAPKMGVILKIIQRFSSFK